MQTLDPIRIGTHWLFPDGTVLPVISGGSDAGGGGGGGDGDAGTGDSDKGGEPERTFTQADLDRIVGERVKRVKEQFADYDRIKQRLEQLEEQTKSETEKQVDRARKEAAEEARREERAKADTRIIRAEVKAAAGPKLRDPEDAVRLLDLSQFKVGDDGEVDTKAISAAIDRLISEKPYLAATDKQRVHPDVGQGRRDNAPPSAWAAGEAEAERRFGKRGAA